MRRRWRVAPPFDLWRRRRVAPPFDSRRFRAMVTSDRPLRLRAAGDPALGTVMHEVARPIDPQHRGRRRRIDPAPGVVGGSVPADSVESPVQAIGEEDRLVVVCDDLNAGRGVHEVGPVAPARYTGGIADGPEAAGCERRRGDRGE